MKVPEFIQQCLEDGDWCLFLDRDGTINKRLVGEYVVSYHQFEFLPGIIESLKEIQGHFKYLFIVTNQQGIGKELMTHEDLSRIHQQMTQDFTAFGIHIDQIYYCPELAIYDSPNRKPNPGMALQAQQDFEGVDFKKSIMIGDTLSDMQFGKNLGMKTIWVDHKVKGDVNPSSELYDLYISSLTEIKELFY